MFGLFDVEDPNMKSSVKTLLETFNFNDKMPGIPRYENDEYRRSHNEITGNLWFIPSMWLAQYSIDTGDSPKAKQILDWVQSCALSTGMMAEQYDPVSKENVSPTPLTWTHSEYVSTLLDLVEGDHNG